MDLNGYCKGLSFHNMSTFFVRGKLGFNVTVAVACSRIRRIRTFTILILILRHNYKSIEALCPNYPDLASKCNCRGIATLCLTGITKTLGGRVLFFKRR